MTKGTQLPAVTFVVFNRPRQTQIVMEAIRAARPRQLFIAADGPRAGHSTDAQRCRAVRNLVENVDWPCEVRRNYSDANLGCKLRPSSAFDWVFSHVDRAIILEDDCVPHPDFFGFCAALLERYAADERVWAVTGQNYQGNIWRGNASYYFSRYNHVWGWATWRRAWRHYQAKIPFWHQWRSSDAWRQCMPDPSERRMWERIFNKVSAGELETAWDYPWGASVWYHNGLTATPNVNLVSNIGFGPDATHTKADFSLASQPTFPLCEIVHPCTVVQNVEADRATFNRVFGANAHARLTVSGVSGAVARRVRAVLRKARRL